MSEGVGPRPIRALAWLIATGFGSGLSPIAPGTVGSLAAVVAYYFSPLEAGSLLFLDGPDLLAFGLLLSVSFMAGIWASHQVSSKSNPDPGYIVWDEFVGMWVTCLFLPKYPLTLGIAFLVFRLFDVVKPFPIRRLERLHGGLGIMADDLLAGIYGAFICNMLFLIALTQYN